MIKYVGHGHHNDRASCRHLSFRSLTCSFYLSMHFTNGVDVVELHIKDGSTLDSFDYSDERHTQQISLSSFRWRRFWPYLHQIAVYCNFIDSTDIITFMVQRQHQPSGPSSDLSAPSKKQIRFGDRKGSFAAWRNGNPLPDEDVCWSWASQKAPCHHLTTCPTGRIVCGWRSLEWNNTGCQHDIPDECSSDDWDSFLKWLEAKPWHPRTNRVMRSDPHGNWWCL